MHLLGNQCDHNECCPISYKWRCPLHIFYLHGGGGGGGGGQHESLLNRTASLPAVVQYVNIGLTQTDLSYSRVTVPLFQSPSSSCPPDDTLFVGGLSLLVFMRHHFRVLEKTVSLRSNLSRETRNCC